ncbi:MAG: sugar phosphate isomerase/epimerase family protein [Mariniblastus sp.]
MNPNNTDNNSQTSAFALGVSDFSTSEPLLNAEKIIASGMDFIEPGLAKIAAMSDADFEAACQRIKDNNIRVQSANWFLPPDLKVTGPDVDDEKSRSFLQHALARAVALGATAVVFGSPGSRSVPDGFSTEKAREQMVAFCRLCSDVIKDNNWPIKIAVEHVNHTETNFVNTFAQALSIVREVERPEIGLAADLYHFAMEDEPMDIMLEAADLICAVQLANPEGRCFPKPSASVPGLEAFFQFLADIGYQGGVSVEATVGEDLEADCRGAVERLTACTIQLPQ